LKKSARTSSRSPERGSPGNRSPGRRSPGRGRASSSSDAQEAGLSLHQELQKESKQDSIAEKLKNTAALGLQNEKNKM